MNRETKKTILLDQFNYLNSKKSNWFEGLNGFIKFTKQNPEAYPERTRYLKSIGYSKKTLTKDAREITPNAFLFNKQKFPMKKERNVGKKLRQAVDKVSGNVKFGNDQTSGYVPIVLAAGLVLFMLTSFTGLFSKN